jgi:hypothetical protein
VVIITTLPLYPRKNLPYPNNRRLFGGLEQFWTFSRRELFFSDAGIYIPDLEARSLVALPIMLSWITSLNVRNESFTLTYNTQKEN